MRLPIQALLLVLPVIGVTPASGGTQILQAEGILEPFDLPNVCDQGETHLLTDPCTGEFIYVESLTAAFNCKYVFVEGPDVGISSICPMIDAINIIPVDPPCLVQIHNLTLRRIPGGYRVDWFYFACTDSYDVIRGTVSELTSKDIGAVLCLENNRVQSFVDDFSGDEPLSGEAFFYLVRPNGPAGFLHYGYSSAEFTRSPAFGDCPTD